ncbi:MAG: SPL family radical SAM protein [Candidatus Hecatellaceae archaeon]
MAWANGCSYHCSYCYLQGTFRGNTNPTVFSNLDDMLREVSCWLKKPGGPRLLNTGELCDSLAITDKVMRALIPIFGRQKRHKLLLLTKSDRVEGLLGLPHNGQTIVSFSVNPPEVSSLFEPDAAPPERRLEAAWKCFNAGYTLDTEFA